MAAMAGRWQGYSETVVTATEAAQIWICGRGFGKTASTAETTRWRRKLGLAVASETAMSAAIRQKQWRRELGLVRDSCNSGSANVLT